MKNFIVNKHFYDLNPLLLGEEKCEPSHKFGPAVRSYVLIHFVLCGEGTLVKKGKEYKIGPGEAFIICPGEITTYSASEINPWHYIWIGFDGELSKNFVSLHPVFRYRNSIINRMIKLTQSDAISEYKVASLLFDIYSDLFETEKPQKSYTDAVKDYIDVMYMQNVTVEDIARQLSLDRRYLSHLFKKNTGQTVQDYLISVRMSEAKKMLLEGISVSNAARLCGYDDVCNFQKMFKRKTGVSPGKWRAFVYKDQISET